ncbi:hypothetical protein HNY73_007434 [Argiope bruennichi]|uniref:Uncharacterized protein n=1 Tax=Argiope bruennichi TaxID=94029 RepID=A0A8T0FEV5_ARGBR|nr:hypothetical protein HNY73_007434 [Argiope bruennichi]
MDLTVQIDKLDGAENWSKWKWQMKMHFEQYNLTSIIDGTKICPVAVNGDVSADEHVRWLNGGVITLRQPRLLQQYSRRIIAWQNIEILVTVGPEFKEFSNVWESLDSDKRTTKNLVEKLCTIEQRVKSKAAVDYGAFVARVPGFKQKPVKMGKDFLKVLLYVINLVISSKRTVLWFEYTSL